MNLVEGSVIIINSACGCTEKRITLLSGRQVIKCPECGKNTIVDISKNNDGSLDLLVH